LNTVLTVAKYEPMGTTIMAKVKARSLTITSLEQVRFFFFFFNIYMSMRVASKKCLHVLSLGPPRLVSPGGNGVKGGDGGSYTYIGTAGAMLDLVPAAELPLSMSSLSRMVFSVEMILWVAMAEV
jgi:hypothetical protein